MPFVASRRIRTRARRSTALLGNDGRSRLTGPADVPGGWRTSAASGDHGLVLRCWQAQLLFASILLVLSPNLGHYFVNCQVTFVFREALYFHMSHLADELVGRRQHLGR